MARCLLLVLKQNVWSLAGSQVTSGETREKNSEPWDACSHFLPCHLCFSRLPGTDPQERRSEALLGKLCLLSSLLPAALYAGINLFCAAELCKMIHKSGDTALLGRVKNTLAFKMPTDRSLRVVQNTWNLLLISTCK